ncbi:hypothetical protein DSO57_1014979 [Entomophthora muscae]|uniref:Uncharacterized protein n=1 Tax=Entomophthora muscae TaxID=34485 RepID=A0ACC2UQB2_9FUNG|nr:hypothetical protein DSO57_1014979 [Entomophthora muscae]
MIFSTTLYLIVSCVAASSVAPKDLTHLTTVLKEGITGDAPAFADQEIVDVVEKYTPYAGLSYYFTPNVEIMECGHCKSVSAKYNSTQFDEGSATKSVVLVDEEEKMVVSFRGCHESFKPHR